ncbi:sugar ABC transporter ATP-binding protein [Paenibacillus alvei]|uniref:sugar ABC transporter ATP-binding protein n=1 Tax=Paenibacillus alvei TaxID=44250 RepID=UPI001F506958|nr:sugar ABC transporter ATP-binding protein [Paenibacillus alvei]MBG9733669.1 ABC transporter [Paenibacillus alvei]MBG9745788.1 ABC transporter [Paenibacillus alvei]MCY9580372.1 sugar ABC transporter ATP-binding protein [Paenibacillus alvei]MCY9583302.1 sugar ABC transporter ATP-binding protein [Paenibacillus alvei]
MEKTSKILLEMKDISIQFPGVQALNRVQFTTETGTAHALIGANGAGKSTLMKALSGAYSHYTGEIRMDGELVTIRSPRHAKDLGIQIVYQEVDTALVPYLTVGENIMLDEMVHATGSKHWVRWNAIHSAAAQILRRMNVQVPTKKLISELTLAEKQMVLIARSISKKCRFLILDEPTAPLSHAETAELFRIVRNLKAENVGVIFISHRLPELFEICDDITIMRDGKLVTKMRISDTSPNETVELMLGKKLDEQFPERISSIGDMQFEVRNLSDACKIANINMHVCKGEIVGIAGLVGAGKTELCKAMFGASDIRAGQTLLHERVLKVRNSYDAVKAGLALVPEERRKEGILIFESVVNNLTAVNLSKFCRWGSFLQFRKEREEAERLIGELDIKTPNEQTKVQHLSGGNQQKVAIGKWLLADAEVYIFDEPTKGVDVGAKKDIFELISRLAEQGKSVIYASCELSEIVGITDRVYVLYDGHIVKELHTNDTNEEELLFYSTGGK